MTVLPDLVLVDGKMPDVDGREFISAARARTESDPASPCDQTIYRSDSCPNCYGRYHPKGLPHRTEAAGCLCQRNWREGNVMLFGRGRSNALSVPATGPPRDVEALEDLISALADVQDEDSAWQITIDSTVHSNDFSYGAVWLPDGKGNVVMRYETGAATAPLRAVVQGQPVPADVGLVGRVLRGRQPLYLDDLSGCGDCLRCQAAARAGMCAAVVTPVMRAGDVVAVLEYYGDRRLGVDGPRTEKWASIARSRSWRGLGPSRWLSSPRWLATGWRSPRS
jgi:hypothetical protein